MRRLRSSSVSAVALSAALLLGVTACSDDGGGDGPAAASADGAVDGAALAQGLFDAMAEAGSVSFTITADGGGESRDSEGVMRYADGAWATHTRSGVGDESTEIIAIDGEFYISLGIAGTGDEARFVRVDVDSEDAAIAQVNEIMPLLQADADPGVFIQNLGRATNLTRTGSEDVDGVATTRYEGVLALDVLLEGMSEEIRTDLEEALGDTEIAITVWVGEDGRPVRILQDVPLHGVDSTATTTFHGWGEPVTIEAPSADRLTDRLFPEGADLGVPPEGGETTDGQ